MNITIPPAPPRRTARRSFSVLAAALFAVSAATAANWYLDKNQPQYSSWDTLADWKPAADGTGTSPVALSSADTYHANGLMLRTPEGSSTYTFGGGLLSFTHSADKLSLKTTGAGVGDGWSNATGWRSKNPNLDTQDPVGRLIYEAHCYFDNNLSGTYDQTYDGEGAYPMIGVDRVREFVEWLQETGNKGLIGEYGVPGNNARWNTVLDNFLAYLDANGVQRHLLGRRPLVGQLPPQLRTHQQLHRGQTPDVRPRRLQLTPKFHPPQTQSVTY